MVVRIGCMYPDDWEVNNYEDGERIQIGSDVLSANFMILENKDQDEALNGREGELPTSFDYELHGGQLCAIVEGRFIPCEDNIEFEQRLNEIDYES